MKPFNINISDIEFNFNKNETEENKSAIVGEMMKIIIEFS